MWKKTSQGPLQVSTTIFSRTSLHIIVLKSSISVWMFFFQLRKLLLTYPYRFYFTDIPDNWKRNSSNFWRDMWLKAVSGKNNNHLCLVRWRHKKASLICLYHSPFTVLAKFSWMHYFICLWINLDLSSKCFLCEN